jgi:capsular polysaccharide biosynthesis protein
VVGQKQDSDAPIDLGADIQGLQQLTQTIAKAIGTCPTADLELEVIQDLEIHEPAGDFLGDLSVEQTGATQFVRDLDKHTDPEQGKRIFNAPRDEFSEQVSDVTPTTNAITATVWEQATVPDTPVSPNPARKGLLALMVETTLGVGLGFLTYFDDSWQSSEEAKQLSGMPTFSFIPGFEEPKVKKGDD